MLDYVVLDPAYNQLEIFYDYYFEKHENLAYRLLNESKMAIEHVRIFANSRPLFYKSFRSISLQSFPVKAIYSIEENTIVVVAFVSAKGSPKELKKYLRNQMRGR